VSIFAARKSKLTLQLRRLAPSETVGSIKQRVLKETGISVDAQRLMWNQETLDDERTVCSLLLLLLLVAHHPSLLIISICSQ
jgi:hypothetical protein